MQASTLPLASIIETSRRLISPLAKSSKVVRIDLPWHKCEFTDHSILCANLVSKTSCLPFLKSGATVSWPGRCRLSRLIRLSKLAFVGGIGAFRFAMRTDVPTRGHEME